MTACSSRSSSSNPAPYRNPDPRRSARQYPLPERTRGMLDPAPPPEGGRGSAVALRHAQDAQGDGRAMRRPVARRGVLQRGHGRTDRQRRGPDGGEFLLPRNEHAFAGRTSRYRSDHRHRPRRADDPRRLRRKAQPDAGRYRDRWLGDRKLASMPKTPIAGSCPPPGGWWNMRRRCRAGAEDETVAGKARRGVARGAGSVARR